MKGKKREETAVDATVIDEQILRRAVQHYIEQHRILAKEVEFDILKIQYLESFGQLEKLQLDNNVIEKVENLSHLSKLTWLDLSFNRISRIQGLDRLQSLKDLSLFSNRIKELGGLDSCARLNVFSIGNNQILSFEEIITYFGRGAEKKTRFKYLQVLNVRGNPFTLREKQHDKEYEAHLIAQLPNLRYLDYVFIDERRRKEIRQMDDKFKTEDQAKFLQELRIEEEKQMELEDDKRKKERAKMHLLDGFAEEIVRIDDLDKLLKMHGLEEEIQKFSLKVKELVEAMQKRIKDEHQRKLQELQVSQERLNQREFEAEKLSTQAIKAFQKVHKAFIKGVEGRDETRPENKWREETAAMKTQVLHLRDKLLAIEVALMEDADALFKKEILLQLQDYSKRILSILNEEQKDEKNEDTGFFKKIEDEIKDFGAQLERITREEIERFTTLQNSGETETEFSSDPELNNILQNKETIPGMVSTIKELLIEKKSKKESEIEHELITKDKEAFKRHYDERQYERNRNNVHNVHEKIEELLQHLNKLISQDD